MDEQHGAEHLTEAPPSAAAFSYAATIFWLGWIATAAPLGFWFALQDFAAFSGGLFVCWFLWMLVVGIATAIASLRLLPTSPGQGVPEAGKFFSVIALEVLVAAAIAVAAFAPEMRIQPWSEARAL